MIKRIPIPNHSQLQIFVASIPFVFGIIMILGWVTRTPLAVQATPEFVAMVFNTALCFVIAGFAALSPHSKIKNYRRTQILSGYILILIGTLVLIETFFSIDLLIDLKSVHEWLKDGNPTPGRMAPNTATGFIIYGLVLILMHHISSKWIVQAIPLLIFVLILIGVTGMVGYFLKFEFLYSWYQYTRMAITTAIGMALLGISLWLTWHNAEQYNEHYQKSEDERISQIGGAILALIALTTGLIAFTTLQRGMERSLNENLLSTLNSRANLFENLIEQSATRAELIANRPGLIRHLRRLSANPNDHEAVFLVDEVLRSFVPLGFTGIGMYTLQGHEISTTGRFNKQELATPLNLHHENSLFWGDGFFLRTRIPILDDGKAVGYVIAEQTLPVISKFMLDITGFGATGETGLCVLREKTIHCFPQRFNPRVFSVPTIKDGKPLPMTYALEGKIGTITTKDYRRKNVIAAYGPVGKLGLGMVLKIDTAEFYMPIKQQLYTSIPVLLFLVLSGTLLLRSQIKPLAARLIRSEEQARSANKLLEEEKLHIQAVVAHVADGIVTIDEAKIILSFNPAAEKMFGYSATEVVGKNITLLIPEIMGTSNIDITVKNNIELSGQRKDGSIMQIEFAIAEMMLGKKRLFVGIMRDITERKIAEQRLTYLAQYDSLTGLANRFLFNDQLQRAMARSARNRQLVGLMYLDIDYFKNVNDEMGHDMGDALLKNFAVRLKESIRETDTIARLGGDEFTIILEGLHQPEDASLVAQKIIEKMKTGFYLDGHHLFVTTSIGIALCYGNEINAEALIKKADQALYRAKESGRNTYCQSE